MTMATAIVVLQVTLILSNREPNLWVFSLLQHKKPVEIWTNFSQNYHSGQNISGLQHGTPFAQCLEQEWGALPEHCRLWYHSTQEISSIFNGGTWNPHLIILVLASIHLVICFSTSQEHHYVLEHEKPHDDLDVSIKNAHESISTRIYHFPLGLSLFFLSLLSLIVGLVSSNRHIDMHIMDAPTIVISLFLFFSASWFLYIQYHYYFEDCSSVQIPEYDNQNRRSHSYPLWVLIFQLQIVGVPLTVLMISVMGVRFYTDIVTHFLLLSAAVNSLWLQRHLQTVVLNDMILVIVRFLTCGIPLFCFFLAQTQWGNQKNTWGQITVFMAFLSLAPLFVFTLFPLYTSQMLQEEDDPVIKKHNKKWNQIQLRLGNFCTSAALGSTVINLALL